MAETPDDALLDEALQSWYAAAQWPTLAALLTQHSRARALRHLLLFDKLEMSLGERQTCIIRMAGLTDRPELNGCDAFLLGRAADGRFPVKVIVHDGVERSYEHLRVWPTCLRRAPLHEFSSHDTRPRP